MIIELDEQQSAGLKVGQRVGMGFLSSTCQVCEVGDLSRSLTSDVYIK